MLGLPVKVGDGDGIVRRPPPLLGEHTRDVLEALDEGRPIWETRT